MDSTKSILDEKYDDCVEEIVCYFNDSICEMCRECKCVKCGANINREVYCVVMKTSIVKLYIVSKVDTHHDVKNV